MMECAIHFSMMKQLDKNELHRSTFSMDSAPVSDWSLRWEADHLNRWGLWRTSHQKQRDVKILELSKASYTVTHTRLIHNVWHGLQYDSRSEHRLSFRMEKSQTQIEMKSEVFKKQSWDHSCSYCIYSSCNRITPSVNLFADNCLNRCTHQLILKDFDTPVKRSSSTWLMCFTVSKCTTTAITKEHHATSTAHHWW